MEYAVKGETRDGRIMILKRGFVTYEAAEDHPVKMSDWRRVWIEVVETSNSDGDYEGVAIQKLSFIYLSSTFVLPRLAGI